MEPRTSLPEADLEAVIPVEETSTHAAALGKRGAAAFVTPAFLLVGVFLIFPALWTLYLGVTNYRLTGLAAAAAWRSAASFEPSGEKEVGVRIW